MMLFNMQLLLACLLSWSWCVYSREIIISEKGSDTPSCLEEHDPLVSCQSLVKVSEYVTSNKLNNVTIRINDTNYTLQGVANFSGVENVSITGKGRSLTHINCNSTHTHGAGIAFDNSSCIALTNFTISNCGATIVNTNRSHLTGSGTAIQIIDCSQVSVLSIMVYRSISQGLTFINTGSTVQVIDSYFINNTISQSQWLGGGALQILFHGTKVLNHNNYTITGNTFQYNNASTNKHKYFYSKYYEKGGGIRIILFNNVCSNSNFTLDGNILEGNIAVFGGGALICVSGSASNNRILILNSKFIGNKVSAGGGGIDMGYTTYKEPCPTKNTVTVLNSLFIDNIAGYGGGLSTYASSVRKIEHYNYFDCINCLFVNNSAQCGAAVSASRGVFTKYGSKFINRVYFTDCKFEGNIVIFKSITSILDGNQNGAFFISEVTVTFSGTTNFTGNNGTALYLDSTYYSTSAVYNTNSFAYFSNNTGYQGGAMVLVGRSGLYAGNNSYFYFTDNTATKFSGAICAITSKRVFSNMYLKTCFLKLDHRRIPSNVSFHFHNNKAIIGYIDIYATSIKPCIAFCNDVVNNSANLTFYERNCFGNFTFKDSKKHVTTSPQNITFDFQIVVQPGIEASLKIVQYDELGGNVSQLFPFTARVQSSGQNAEVANYYNNSIILLGFQGDKGELLLESPTYTRVVGFELSYCGPGFVFVNSSRKCVCSNKLDYTSIECYYGTATIASNYWAGYNSENATQDNLLTGLCVTQLCNQNISCNNKTQLCSLPQEANTRVLEERICGENRHGRLCGRCVQNTSVYYHSSNFTCGNTTSCQYGIPIYIASELIPVTIIFLIILLFNISLTSGAVYSFIFYVQIISLLNVTAFGTIRITNQITKQIVDIFEIIIGILAFDIRIGGEFCIFQTDTIMNILMIKYATLVYAFFLVIATILIMRVHSCYSCVKLCRRCGRRNIRGSIVDGLSAFLVLCYFQCAAITSHILKPSHLFGIYHKWNTTVALFDGELDYLKGDHQLYAVPAFLCMIFILIPPPTILILEPILTKLFSMDCFTSTAPKWYYNKLRLKLMPFLDSFQACFKDRHRYFAGLYFLYRLLFPITGMIVQGPQHYYSFAICIFMFILLSHVLLQPYNKRWHNLLEISLFINIIFLLIITLYNLAFNKSDGTQLINAQLILIFLSIGYMVVYIAIKVYQKLSSLKTKKETPVNRECTEVNDSLPYRLLNDNNDVTISNSYRTF